MEKNFKELQVKLDTQDFHANLGFWDIVKEEKEEEEEKQEQEEHQKH